jgi:hypothetical protein
MQFTLSCLFVLSVAVCHSQDLLSGKVTDSKTGAGVPFANIVLKTAGSGVASDAVGGFSMKIAPAFGHDTLLFSAIGYQTLRKAVIDVQRNKLTEFKLKDTVYTLQTMVFVDTLKSAINIIRKAMDKVKENYGTQPHKLEGIFRIIDKENGTYARMLEAAVGIYDPDFRLKNSREVDYLAIRQTKDYRTYNWKMNHSNVRIAEDLLQPDLIKRPTRATHENGFRVGFTYDFDDMTYLDGEEIYVVDVKKRSETSWANYDAKFYVRVKDLAILRVDRTYSIPRNHWIDANGVSTVITTDKLTLIYREHNEKLFLNYFSWQLKGQAVNQKSKKVELEFERWEELFVHNVSFEKKSTKMRKAWSKDIYQMTESFNEKFWKVYPVIDTELFREVEKQLSKKESLQEQFKIKN